MSGICCVRIVKIRLTEASLQALFNGSEIRFAGDDLEVRIDLDFEMKDSIEKAMLEMLPTSPTLN